MCLAVPGQVEEIYQANGTRMGKVNFGGVVKDVCLAYVPEITIGEYAIVHVGFAISKIDEASALKTLSLFEEIGMLEAGRGGEFGESSDQACHIQPLVDPASADPRKPI